MTQVLHTSSIVLFVNVGYSYSLVAGHTAHLLLSVYSRLVLFILQSAGKKVQKAKTQPKTKQQGSIIVVTQCAVLAAPPSVTALSSVTANDPPSVTAPSSATANNPSSVTAPSSATTNDPPSVTAPSSANANNPQSVTANDPPSPSSSTSTTPSGLLFSPLTLFCNDPMLLDSPQPSPTHSAYSPLNAHHSSLSSMDTSNSGGFLSIVLCTCTCGTVPVDRDVVFMF